MESYYLRTVCFRVFVLFA